MKNNSTDKEAEFRKEYDAEKERLIEYVISQRTKDRCKAMMTDSDLQLRFLCDLFALHTTAIALITSSAVATSLSKEQVNASLERQEQAVFGIADIIAAMRVRKEGMKTLAATLAEDYDESKN